MSASDVDVRGLSDRTGAKSGDRSLRLVGRLELIVAILITVAIVGAHVTFVLHAGALWRDEIHTVNIATAPMGEFWKVLEFESYPALWPLVLRGWDATGLGATDTSLRVLGLLVGLAVLALLWWQARVLSNGPPLLVLVLVGASPTLVCWGDTMRAYGFGALMGLGMILAVWRVVERPTWRRTVVAAIVAALAVQTVYYNAILLLAMGVGAAAVGLRRRDWRRPAAVMAAGLAAAALLVPYWPYLVDAGGWKELIRAPIQVSWLAHELYRSVAVSGSSAVALWFGLGVMTVVACVGVLGRRGDRGPAGSDGATPVKESAGPGAEFLAATAPREPAGPATPKDLALFILTALPAAAVCYTLFLLAVSYFTTAWYYLLIMIFVAVFFEAAIALLIRSSPAARAVRVGLCVVMIGVMAPHVWEKVNLRLTNVDRLAQTLEARAGPDDFILLAPWWPGITFSRYYHGATPWRTVPEMEDLRMHRFDLMKLKIMQADPVRPSLRRIEATLQAGHRVWFIGNLPESVDGDEPLPLAPMPDGPGWKVGPYDATWMAQVAWLIRRHGATVTRVEVPLGQNAYGFENMPLLCVEGWQ
jgi:hypothetical protein